MSNPTIDRRFNVAEGTAVKAPVRVATTASITLSGLQTIDGITLAEQDRVLVKNQTSAVLNGIYEASTGNWSRTKDFDGARDVVSGTRVMVRLGTLNALNEFVVTTLDPLPGTSTIDFIGRVPTTVLVGTVPQYLSPEQFGNCGISAALDTAAWTAMAAVVQDGDIIRATGTYLINGRITFQNANNLTFDLRLSTIRQQERFKWTIALINCSDPAAYLGKMYGFAAIDIAASPAALPSEWAYDGTLGVFNPLNPAATRNVDSGHYTGVAAFAVYQCSGIARLYGGDLEKHVGGGVYIFESHFYIDGLKSRGIGADYINPIDNGADFPVSFSLASGPNMSSDWQGEIVNLDIDDHAFCFGGTHLGSFVSHSHRRLACIGQHAHYVTETSNLHVHGFTVGPCPQGGVKVVMNNDAGEYFSTGWISENIFTGDERRTSHILFRATENITPSTNISTETIAGKWIESPRMLCYRHSVHDITGDQCGHTVLYGGQGTSSGVNSYFKDVLIHDITARDGIIGVSLNRVIDATIHHIRIEGMSDVGFFASDMSGTIDHINIKDTASAGMNIAPVFKTKLDNIVLTDCGIDIPGPTASLIIAGHTSAFISARDSNPVLEIGKHEIFFSGGAAAVGALTYLISCDPIYLISLMDGRTNSDLTANVPTVVFQTRNNYTFVASTPNDPIYTATASTLRSIDALSTTGNVRDVVRTLILDLQANGTLPPV